MSDSVIGGLVYKISSDSSALKKDLADVKRIGETLSASLQSEVNKGTSAAASIIASFQNKTVAQLSSLKGKIDVDVTDLQKQAALLQEAIQHKEALAKVKAIGLDVTELEKAETLLQELSRVNRKTIEIEFQTPKAPSIDLSGVSSKLNGVVTGIFQGIGQQISLTITNAIGNALGDVKNILTDRKAFNDFDAAKTSLKSLGADADELAGYAAKAAKELQGLASTREILASSYQIVSSGFQGKDAIDIATIAKKTAVATPETSGATADAGVVGDAMTTVLKSYRLGAEQATNVSQQMIGVVNAGKIKMWEYASLIGNVSSNAYAAGISLNDLNSVIAASTQNGVKAEAAMTGVNAAASAIAKPSSEALEYAKKLGLDFSLAGMKAAGGFVPFLQKLKDVGATDFGSITRLFGSVEAAKALNPVLSSLGSGFADIKRVVEGQDLTKQFDAASQSVARLQDKQKALREELDLKFQTALAPIFEAGNVALTGVLQNLGAGGLAFNALQGATQSFTETLKQNPTLIQALTNEVATLLQDGINVLTSGVQNLTAYLEQNPGILEQMVTQAASLAASIGQGVVLAAQFVQGFVEGGQAIASVLEPLFSLINFLPGAVSTSGGFAENMGKVAAAVAVFAVGSAVFSTVASVFAVLDAAAGILVAAAPIITSGVVAIGSAFTVVGETIAAIAAGLSIEFLIPLAAIAAAAVVVYEVFTHWSEITQFIGNLWNGLVKTLTEMGTNIDHSLSQSQVFGGVWGFIKDLVASTVKPYIDIYNYIAQGVEKSGIFQSAWSGMESTFKSVGGWIDQYVVKPILSAWDALKGLMGQGNSAGSNAGSSGGSNAITGTIDQQKLVEAALLITEGQGSNITVRNRAAQNYSGYGNSVLQQALAPQQYTGLGGQDSNGSHKQFTAADFQSVETLAKALNTSVGDVQQAIRNNAKTEDADIAAIGYRTSYRANGTFRMEPSRGDIEYHGNSYIGDEGNRNIRPKKIYGLSANAPSDAASSSALGWGSNSSPATSPSPSVSSGIIQGANVQTNPLLASGGKDTKLLDAAILAARKGQDEQIKLQRDEAKKAQDQQNELQKLAIEKQLAATTNPDARAALQDRQKALTVGSQYDTKIQDLNYQKADVTKARDRKVTDLSGNDPKLKQAAQDAPDYTAALKAIDTEIAAQQKLKEAALGVSAVQKESTEALKTETTQRAARDASAKNAYEVEKSKLELSKSLAAIDDAGNVKAIDGQLKRLDLNYKTNTELQKEQDKLKDLTTARDQYAATLGKGQSDSTLKNFDTQLATIKASIETIKATSADGLKVISAQDQKDAADLALKLQGIEQSKSKLQGDLSLSLVKGQAGLLKGRGQDTEATALENQAAKAQEQLRYKQQLLDIDRQIAEANKNGIPFTSDQVAKLKTDAGQLNQINLSGIDQQFKSLGQTIADNVGKSFGDALTSIIDGTKSVSEAFTGMLKNIASQLLQQGINRLIGSLFGGLFGGGGGLFGGGGMSSGVSSSFGGGGLLSGIFGFAEGGIVGDADSGYSSKSIHQALKKEGPRSQLIAATPGELILSVPQTRAFFSMGMDRKVLTMSAGGIVPGAASPSSASGSSGNGVNLSQHFTISNDSNAQNNQKFADMAKETMLNLILSQKRPGGLLAT